MVYSGNSCSVGAKVNEVEKVKNNCKSLTYLCADLVHTPCSGGTDAFYFVWFLHG